MKTERRQVDVAAGLIWDRNGKVLISQRPANGSHGGSWELPGGKLEKGESSEEALEREIMEELGIRISAGPEFGRVTHDYEKLTVTLIGHHALYVEGKPQKIAVDDWKWIKPEELLDYSYPEANQKLFNFDMSSPPKEWKINQ